MRFLSVNSDSFLIELGDLQHTMQLYRHLRDAAHPHIREMVPAAATILVYFNPLQITARALIHWIKAQKPSADTQSNHRHIEIEVCYDGPDLPHVAELLNLSVKEVIERHTQAPWQVAFIGFAPGFGYLSRADQPFGSVPRLDSPRKKIQSGSLALAGEYSGIYPKDSPGGWQLIGQTTCKMWDLTREHPALLLPGDQVRFIDVTHRPTRVAVHDVELKTADIAQSELSPILEVLQAGLQTLIQDEGRKHVAAMGVGAAGAMDRAAYHLANQIVGNRPDAAALEVLNGGVKFKVLAPTVVAVTGAQSNIWVIDRNAVRSRVSGYTALALDPEDMLQIDPPQAGIRNYLAVRGGVATAHALGSASYDTLAELGPAPLQVHDLICVGNAAVSAVELYAQAPDQLAKVGEVIEIDVVLGPRTDWFEPESIQQFFKQQWQVTHESNRVGLRLKAPYGLKRQILQELPSEGTCTGALQIPPNGQPVLFMNDHPLTGGYPVLAAVATHDLNKVAQIPPGAFIQFRQFTHVLDLDAE